ncbi:hypothetical protein [Bifidobacterium pseudocatenulatum]|uniref:hypothetical protein n=1 Tax=Bifidobacterium pseudocatenulatum TaxID=28026 RepID=UPI001CFE5F2A|nr:hypothetical protein [Bifidobacterium pseudocatenulatum]MCB4912548.1 hypothetical protein [Bifidobacterium pseudocatenulatum]
MSSQYKVRALYWSYHDGYYLLKHQGELEDLLNDGWEISRGGCHIANEFSIWRIRRHERLRSRKAKRGKAKRGHEKSSVSEFPPHDMGLRVGILPHDMGLRVELDTNGTYYLKSGWKEHCDWIYGLAWRYTDGSGIVSASRPDNPVPIAIMNSHVRLATSFDEHETGTTKQSEDTNMKETNR